LFLLYFQKKCYNSRNNTGVFECNIEHHADDDDETCEGNAEEVVFEILDQEIKLRLALPATPWWGKLAAQR